MSSSANQLTDAEQSILSTRADQFFDALSKGNAGDWRPFLSGLDGKVRPFVLTELIIIEMGHKWSSGEKVTVEEYLSRFPELGPTDQVPAKLILEEHLCRIKAGEPTDLDGYRSRFPKQYPTIKAELEASTASNQTRVSASAPAFSAGPASTGTTRSEGLLSVSQQYEFVKELGRGMFGEVWLARKKPSGIEKAVKILLQPADRDAAKREFRSLELIKNLRHPYLLATEDFWVAENRLHVVMELADGTLRTRFKECRRQMLPGIPEDELLNYFQEAAEGLDYLHLMKITHRDVKPDNILILHNHAKVADFGLARHQDAIMASMSFAGTPAYMAPEIWGGEGGPASDQYSLAFTYAELRQGKVPIPPKASMQDMMIAHLDGQFEFDEHVIGEAEQVVLRKAMARNPDDRYKSCSVFAEELGRSLGRSFLRKSSKIAMPSTRPAPASSKPPAKSPPSTAEPLRLTSSGQHKPLGSVSGGTGSHKSLKTVTSSQASTGTKVGAGIITDRSGPQSKSIAAPFRPKSKSAPPPSKVILAVALTLALVVVLAGMVYVLFIHDGKGPTPTTADEKDGRTSVVAGTEKPIDTGKPIDTRRPIDTGKPKDTGKGMTEIKKPTIAIPGGGYSSVEGSDLDNLIEGRQAYQWIAYKVGDDEVRFRLIARPGSGVLPFYIMESKVSAKFFNAHCAMAQLQPRPQPTADPDAPVFNVTAMDAARFANAVFPGGRLPTPKEWDEAAASPEQPLLAKADAVALVKSRMPGPTGRGRSRDENHLGLFDMTGNGTEWTRAVVVPSAKPVQILQRDPTGDKELVVLRGRRYTLAEPLTKAHLKYEQDVPQTQFAGTPNDFTSFRVVVPLQ